MNKKLLYAVDEKPPVILSMALGLQHVLLIFSGIVMVPAIVARAGNVPPDQVEYVAFASLIVSSISTLIQVIRFGKIGSGYVLFMGTSGAFISCSLTAVEMGGFALVATMSLLAAPLEFFASYFLRYLRKIITPEVGGVVIMLVAVNLIPIAMHSWVGYPGTPHYGSFEYLITGLATAFVILALIIFGNQVVRIWAPLIGIFIGYVIAYKLSILELTYFNDTKWFGLPRGYFPGIDMNLSMAHIPLFAAFLMTTLTGAIESAGCVMAAQKISVRNFRKIDYDSIQGCLYSDGLGNLLAGLAGTVPNTTYSSSISVLELTGVAARRVGIFGALFLAVLAFFPKFGAIILDIPGPVLGSSLVIFMGILFSTGILLATSKGLTYRSGLLVGISLCVGIIMEYDMFFHEQIPVYLKPFLSNGIATGGLTAFILSLIFIISRRAQVSLKMLPQKKRLFELNQFIDDNKETLHFTPRQQDLMQLACEEVFIYICESYEDQPARDMSFKWWLKSDSVQVDVAATSSLSDVDIPEMPDNPEKVDPEELAQLGLVILSKIARDVSHIKIGEHNYISFKIGNE